MRQLLNIETWARKDHFHFFSTFEEPFFGVTVDIDCTKAYTIAKANGYSFFLYYLYKSLLAANHIESFRYRILDGEVWLYDKVNASPTINRPDGTFGYAYMDHEDDFETFLLKAQKEIHRIQNSQGLVPAISGENVIHYSSMPWLRFTAVSHARSFLFQDSIPKITFGKMMESGNSKVMPVSIHVHHGLMDGWHVGQYVDYFQQLLNEPK